MVLDNGQFPCGRLRTFKSAAPGGETTVGYFYLRESDPAAGVPAASGGCGFTGVEALQMRNGRMEPLRRWQDGRHVETLLDAEAHPETDAGFVRLLREAAGCSCCAASADAVLRFNVAGDIADVDSAAVEAVRSNPEALKHLLTHTRRNTFDHVQDDQTRDALRNYRAGFTYNLLEFAGTIARAGTRRAQPRIAADLPDQLLDELHDLSV
jgi:PAS domain-containing protein